jgi:D-glycero-D-manno-heptose 1,7-bisphosphate phosphatase
MTKLIILDRDGVINYDSPDYIKSPEEWIPIPGSLEAIANLNHAGYQVAIATNQSGLARGYYDLDMLQRIHQKMHEQLATLDAHIEAIFFCPHLPESHCECRKPQPGLFYQISERFNVDLTKETIPAIGDSLRDLEAAEKAFCKPILVLTGNGQKTRTKLAANLQNIEIYDDLRHATNTLLNNNLS